MGVVVHRLEVERGPELALGVAEPARSVVGAGERLAHRSFLRLEPPSALECHHRGVHVAAGKEPAAFLKGEVGVALVVHAWFAPVVVVHVPHRRPERRAGAVLQPVGIPEPGAPRARLLRICRPALRLRRGRCRPRDARGPTLRRDRRRTARRARGRRPSQRGAIVVATRRRPRGRSLRAGRRRARPRGNDPGCCAPTRLSASTPTGWSSGDRAARPVTPEA